MAGHSKWASIKHKKKAVDAKRGVLFDRLLSGCWLSTNDPSIYELPESGVLDWSKVLVADAPQYAHGLAENVAPLIVELAKGYSHVLAPATSFGKNVLPRVAAMLDVMQLSDVTKVISADTFERPIYAGNAIATVKSSPAQRRYPKPNGA